MRELRFFMLTVIKKKKKVIQITNYTRMTLTVKNERNILLGGTMLQLFFNLPSSLLYFYYIRVISVISVIKIKEWQKKQKKSKKSSKNPKTL